MEKDIDERDSLDKLDAKAHLFVTVKQTSPPTSKNKDLCVCMT